MTNHCMTLACHTLVMWQTKSCMTEMAALSCMDDLAVLSCVAVNEHCMVDTGFDMLFHLG